MEKILKLIKKILLYIPLFLICFSIKNVYAESLISPVDFTLHRTDKRTISINLENIINAGSYTITWQIDSQSGLTSSTPMAWGLYNSNTKIISLPNIYNGISTSSLEFTTESSINRIYAYINSNAGSNATISIKNIQIISNNIPEDPSIPIYNFNNNKYYVPNYEEGQCVEVLDKDTIRVFNDENTSFYVDYYINSNYISRQGQVDLDYVKNCSNLQFTDIRYYGNDFPQILIITICIIVFSVGFPYILYKRFRKR